MVAPRDVLKDENKLLTDLEKTASGNPGGQDWARFFREWRGANEELIRQSDSGFNQGLDDEIKSLEKMRNAISGETGSGAKFWLDMLTLDIESAKSLKL